MTEVKPASHFPFAGRGSVDTRYELHLETAVERKKMAGYSGVSGTFGA